MCVTVLCFTGITAGRAETRHPIMHHAHLQPHISLSMREETERSWDRGVVLREETVIDWVKRSSAALGQTAYNQRDSNACRSFWPEITHHDLMRLSFCHLMAFYACASVCVCVYICPAVCN